MPDPLHIGVVAFGVWAVAALGTQIARAKGYGRREYFADAAGDPWRGVAYAFGPGMSPTAKESVREHIPSYLAGVGFHVGVFTGLAYLLTLIVGIRIGVPIQRAVQVLCLAGTACGIGLLIKRSVDPHLRGLSCPDDFVANLLSTLFAGLAFCGTVWPAWDAAFLIVSMALFLYMPLGKIRHCFFFFTTRYSMGTFFGRRGTFPPTR
jgi:hypothetical protein